MRTDQATSNLSEFEKAVDNRVLIDPSSEALTLLVNISADSGGPSTDGNMSITGIRISLS